MSDFGGNDTLDPEAYRQAVAAWHGKHAKATQDAFERTLMTELGHLPPPSSELLEALTDLVEQIEAATRITGVALVNPERALAAIERARP